MRVQSNWCITTKAAHSRRDVPVVSTVVDARALFSITKLSSAVLHSVSDNIVVMNVHAYGNVHSIQRDEFDGRLMASNPVSPDFVDLVIYSSSPLLGFSSI